MIFERALQTLIYKIMTHAFYLLLLIGHLGAFDVLYFHQYRCRLNERAECQKEVFYHTLRHLIYAAQFLIVASLRFHGWALLILVFIYACDVFIAWADIWSETKSRKNLGGLPSGEYFMHIVLSILVGIYLTLLTQTVWTDRLLATAIVIDPPQVPHWLRLYLSIMGVVAFAAFFHDLFKWLHFRSKQN